MSVGEILRSPGICANGLLVHRFLGRDCQVPLKLKIYFSTNWTQLTYPVDPKISLLNCPVSAKKYQPLWHPYPQKFPWSTTTAPKAVASPGPTIPKLAIISWNGPENTATTAKWRSTTWDIAGDSDTNTVVIIVAGWGCITKNPIHTSGIHRNHAISTCRIFPQIFGPRERLQLEHFFQIYSSRKLHFWQKKNVIPPTGWGHTHRVFLLVLATRSMSFS